VNEHFDSHDIQFILGSFYDLNGHKRSLSEAFKPLLVYQSDSSKQYVYRLHDTTKGIYSPIIKTSHDSIFEFYELSGIKSSDVWEYYLNEKKQEVKRKVARGSLNTRHENHKLEFSGKNYTIGHERIYQCANSFPAVGSADFNNLDGVKVISWKQQMTETYSALSTQSVVLAWCEGFVNVRRVKTLQQFEDCDGNGEDGRDGPNSYLAYGPSMWDDCIQESVKTFYFINGVGNACKNGWKLALHIYCACS